MERDELVAKGKAAFEAGSYEEALKFFSEVMREHQLPEECLFEIGVCELKCAESAENLALAIDTLAKIPTDSDKFASARIEIRKALAEDENNSVLSLRKRYENELAFIAGATEAAQEKGALLVGLELAGRLEASGESAATFVSKSEQSCKVIRQAFAQRWGKNKALEAAETLTKVSDEVAPIAQLWRARFLADGGQLTQALRQFDELNNKYEAAFEQALPGWAQKIKEEMNAMREEELARKRNGLAREEADRARCLYDAGQFDEALEAWEASLASAYSRRTIIRMAATAWHRKGDDLSAFAYLERLSERDKKSSEVKILRRTIHVGLVERIKKYVRLGLRRAAFEELVKLKGLTGGDERTAAELEEIFVEYLSSPWIRLVRERLRKNTGLSFRMQEKDSPVWKLLRQARGHVSEDEEDELDVLPDDPSLLPRVQKETAMLRWLEDLIMQRERRIVDVFSPEQFSELLEDRAGLEEFERLIERIEPILDTFASYSEETHFEVKDFIGSFLPDSLREKVCNEAYLDVVRMENEIERDLAVFLRKHYPGIQAD